MSKTVSVSFIHQAKNGMNGPEASRTAREINEHTRAHSHSTISHTLISLFCSIDAKTTQTLEKQAPLFSRRPSCVTLRAALAQSHHRTRGAAPQKRFHRTDVVHNNNTAADTPLRTERWRVALRSSIAPDVTTTTSEPSDRWRSAAAMLMKHHCVTYATQHTPKLDRAVPNLQIF